MFKLRFKRMFAAADDQPGGNTPPPPVPDPPPEVDLDYTKFDSKIDATIDPNNLSSKVFADKAKELGISVSAAKDLFTTVGDSLVTSRTQYESLAAERCSASLKEVWGDKFEVNNKALVRGTLKLTESDKDLGDKLEQSGAFSNPLVAQLISKVGMMFKEESQNQGNSGTYDAKDPYGFAKADKNK